MLNAGEAVAKSRRAEVVMQDARESWDVGEMVVKANTWEELPQGIVGVECEVGGEVEWAE